MTIGFAYDVEMELKHAREIHPTNISSLHDGYGVILEEMDELWSAIKCYRKGMTHHGILNELIQVAAMCQRMAEDLNLRE